MTIHKTAQPVLLDGFQAILQPSEFGYTLKCVITDASLIEALEDEREKLLEGQKAKLKNQKRGVQKPEPWEEVADGKWTLKFGWKENSKPTIVDAEGTLVTSETLPLYSGSRVRLAFIQKGYTLKDNITYGTSLKLSGIQIISLGSTDGPSMSGEEVADLFGSYEGGFVSSSLPDPVEGEEEETEESEDQEF